jgi:hypothetical protein
VRVYSSTLAREALLPHCSDEYERPTMEGAVLLRARIQAEFTLAARVSTTASPTR